jgi:hypothetical protein
MASRLSRHWRNTFTRWRVGQVKEIFAKLGPNLFSRHFPETFQI